MKAPFFCSAQIRISLVKFFRRKRHLVITNVAYNIIRYSKKSTPNRKNGYISKTLIYPVVT